MSGHVPTTWAHVLLDFRHLIFIKASLCGHVLLHDSPNVQLNRDRRISLMRSMVAIYECVVDLDQMDQSPRDLGVSISAIKSNASRDATLLENQK